MCSIVLHHVRLTLQGQSSGQRAWKGDGSCECEGLLTRKLAAQTCTGIKQGPASTLERWLAVKEVVACVLWYQNRHR